MQSGYNGLKEWLNGKDIQKRINMLAKKYENKKIVLYGAGIMANVIVDNYDLSALNIIGLADAKFYEKEKFYNYEAFSSEKIENYNPDVILILTLNDGQIKDFIKEFYPELAKIPCLPLVEKTLKDKIKALFDACGILY